MLDLKKLKATELPSKEIEIEILGEKQKVEIRCPDDTVAAYIATLTDIEAGNPELPALIIRKVLESALPEVPVEDLAAWMQKDLKSATLAAAEARKLMNEFATARKKTKEQIEKNALPAEGASETNS